MRQYLISRRLLLPAIILITAGLSACVREQPQIVVITSPPENIPESLPQLPDPTPALDVGLVVSPLVGSASPTPDPTHPAVDEAAAQQYIVQPGDTLFAIAQSKGVSLEALIASNQLADPNLLTVGQVINLPALPDAFTSDFKIIPDSRLVRGPGSRQFDTAAFIAQQPGYIRTATDRVNDQTLSAAEVVNRVALEYSVDARLLLALLEYRAGWLSNPQPTSDDLDYPMEKRPTPAGFNRAGLYRQLAWAANQLNRGYYNWRYRGITALEFEDGTRLRYAPGLNAATVGVQYFLSQNLPYEVWSRQITPQGFYAAYTQYFGDPFMAATDPLLPSDLQQPELWLPFPQGQTWFFTGGPHGGWGSGSAWAAVDFAPPDERAAESSACYVSEFAVTAAAAGLIVRSGDGSVVLDLDGDGDEATGWTLLYLHIATAGRTAAGVFVQAGDSIGYPSCEGGFSNGTHLHIARRYNGEWIPVACDPTCAPGYNPPPFVLSGWIAYGLPGQEYQGYLLNSVGDRRNAEQGRQAPDNRISW